MFPLSHIYVSTKVACKESDLLILGSVIPDLAWFSEPLRGALHNEPDDFWNFVKEKYPDFLDLALGVRFHSQIGRGADYYSDDEEIGYAKVNGRKIVKNVASAFGIEEERQALVLSHNFIEAAVDLLLAEKFPSLVRTYQRAIDGDAAEKAAVVISVYLGKDVSLVETELRELFAFFSPENISSLRGVCSNSVTPFLKRTLQKDINFDQVLSVLEQSRELIKGSFLPFLDETVGKMKINFRDLV